MLTYLAELLSFLQHSPYLLWAFLIMGGFVFYLSLLVLICYVMSWHFYYVWHGSVLFLLGSSLAFYGWLNNSLMAFSAGGLLYIALMGLFLGVAKGVLSLLGRICWLLIRLSFGGVQPEQCSDIWINGVVPLTEEIMELAVKHYDDYLKSYWPLELPAFTNFSAVNRNLDVLDTTPNNAKDDLDTPYLNSRSKNSSPLRRHNLLPYLEEVNAIMEPGNHPYYDLLKDIYAYVLQNPGNYLGMVEEFKRFVKWYWGMWQNSYIEIWRGDQSPETIERGLQRQIAPFIELHVKPLVKVNVIDSRSESELSRVLDLSLSTVVIGGRSKLVKQVNNNG